MKGPKSIDSAELEHERRSGRAVLPYVLIIALLLALAFSLWRAGPASVASGELQLPAAEVPGAENSARTLTVPPGAAATAMGIHPNLEIGRSESLPRKAPAPFDEARLNGRGRIRGFLQAPPGVEFPQEWVLSVLPSSSLIGKERAETRRLEFHAGEQDFELPDLALGGYMLRASAFGLASDEQHLLLVKPGEDDLYLSMQLAVTAFIEGSVRYEDSTPAIGLELALEPRPTGVRAVAKTDSIGHFLFTDVKSGGYTLHFGRPESPVRAALEVNMDASPLHLADAIVPKLCDLIVRVSFSPGAPASGVKVDGYGDHGGRIEGLTDADGEYHARFLPAGRFTVSAVFPDGARVQARKTVGVGIIELIELVQKK